MSNCDHLRALYRRFLTDQDFYSRCYARSLAETEHNARKRAALPVSEAATKPTPSDETE